MILGAGLIGRPMAADLAQSGEFEIGMADINESALEKAKDIDSVSTIKQDLSDPAAVKEVIKDSDFVISAVPGFLGFKTLQAIIQAGKDVVDIAFFPEDPFLLNSLAEQNQVTAIVDCGVAPGMSNVLIGHCDFLMDELLDVAIYVGGLPQVREWPYEYKAGFSPIDVIEEYTRPSRYRENGKLQVNPALSDPELLFFPGVGTLEAFLTDGLRSLIHTIPAPNMVEKTMRYPGHIEKMAMLRETGFFSQEEIEVKGKKIRPLDLTTRLLFPMWEMKEGDADLTVLRVIVVGKKAGQKFCYTYDMLDRYDAPTATSSMARTTGYTATTALRMLAQRLYSQKGISPPEYIGREMQCCEFMLAGLKERGVVFRETIEILD